MFTIKPLTTYTPEVAARLRELLKQLSRSGKDKGEIPAAWFEEVINSPSHVLLLAYRLPSADPAPSGNPAHSSNAPAPSANIPIPPFASPAPSNSPALSADLAPSDIVGMATLSLVLGPGIHKNAYLEDFVTDSSVRGQGVGSLLWSAMLDWAREHGAARLEFTCGVGREAAQSFYEHHGAEKYLTNFYRIDLS